MMDRARLPAATAAQPILKHGEPAAASALGRRQPGRFGRRASAARIVGSEAICGGIEYRIACVAGSPAPQLKELIALPLEIQFVTDRGQLRSVCGIVIETCADDSDGGPTPYHLVVRDALAIMRKRTNSRIFRNLNELDIVQVLFDEWRHSNSVLAGAFEYGQRSNQMRFDDTHGQISAQLASDHGASKLNLG